MKIALTVWGRWISPVFDSAQTLLIVNIDNGRVSDSQQVPFDAECPQALVKLLNKLGVSRLICGAISEYPAKILESESLQLTPFITGCIDEIVHELSKGKSISRSYLMPGCRCRKKMRGSVRTDDTSAKGQLCRRNMGKKGPV